MFLGSRHHVHCPLPKIKEILDDISLEALDLRLLHIQHIYLWWLNWGNQGLTFFLVFNNLLVFRNIANRIESKENSLHLNMGTLVLYCILSPTLCKFEATQKLPRSCKAIFSLSGKILTSTQLVCVSCSMYK